MFRTQCVLAFLTLFGGLAHSFSWDIVLGGVKQLEFYDNNGTLTRTEVISCKTTESIAYDPVHNRILFVEVCDSYKSFSSLDIATSKIQSLFKNKEDGNIGNIAYDPVTQLLFWIIWDSNDGCIRSTLIKPGSNYAVYRNLSINFADELSVYNESPQHLAVDSCGGYLYWTTNTKIERARFDGSEKEVVIRSSEVWRNDITIDQQAQKMYWIDSHYYSGLSIESADLNGDNRSTLHSEKHHLSDTVDALTVSNEFAYWRSTVAFWQMPKKSHDGEVKPRKISLPTYHTSPNSYWIKGGLAAYYKINEQSCGTLKGLLPIISVPSDYDYLNDSIVAIALCAHGWKLSKEARCECIPGYIGDRCDVSVCHNYCLQGNCSVSAEGEPKCRCYAGYMGQRCETNACHGYCLNDGVCSLNAASDPVCECTGHYQGERCNISVCQNYCFQGECSVSSEGQPLCRCTAGFSGKRCEVRVCDEYCLNDGVCSLNETNEPVCECRGYYKGQRCNVSICQNYCLHGDCSAGAERQPMCRCYSGYFGERCEVNVCPGYCSNHGVCYLNVEGEPVCQCTKDYEGERCDIPVFLKNCIQ